MGLLQKVWKQAFNGVLCKGLKEPCITINIYGYFVSVFFPRYIRAAYNISIIGFFEKKNCSAHLIILCIYIEL